MFPDIGKISRLGHFKIIWKRHIVGQSDTGMTNDVAMKQSEFKVESISQKKEEGEQFFSVPDNITEETLNGTVML